MPPASALRPSNPPPSAAIDLRPWADKCCFFGPRPRAWDPAPQRSSAATPLVEIWAAPRPSPATRHATAPPTPLAVARDRRPTARALECPRPLGAGPEPGGRRVAAGRRARRRASGRGGALTASASKQQWPGSGGGGRGEIGNGRLGGQRDESSRANVPAV